MRHALVLASSLIVAIVAARLCAEELQLDAESLFGKSVSEHLSFNSHQDAIELQRGVLYEDDGPAAGYSYQPNVEKFAAQVCLRKQLVIPNARSHAATLLVAPGGDLHLQLNGKSTTIELIGKQGNYWQVYRLDAEALASGTNEFALSGKGSIWIARDDEYAAGSLTRTRHPNRSAKSTDEGRTWNDKQLGNNNNLDGEYYVRVHLDQYHQEGRLTTPVIDVANLRGAALAPPVAHVGPVRIRAESTTPAGSEIQLRARTCPSPFVDDTNWSHWANLSHNGMIAKPKGRYLQVEARLATTDPLVSGQLRSLTIAASPEFSPDWLKNIRIKRFANPTIVRTSIPFEYEPFDQPELATLRRKYKLDQVVAGAESEFELIERLAVWSATRWDRMHLKDSYPAYNALEILGKHTDGTPVGGFCQQYNVVFLQACESFGVIGRLVSLGPGQMADKIRSGHEAAEIWSNDYGKWVYIDGNTAWYAVDAKSRKPLSLWELRQRQLTAFSGEQHPAIEVVQLAESKHQWPDLHHWPPFVELRLIPRSNFLKRAAPLPLNQGMRGWFWTGHHVWTDDRSPARLLYSHCVQRRGNFDWTLNQARLHLVAIDRPGIVRVYIDTNTPEFADFVLSVNGKTTSQSTNQFDWKLKHGENSLRVVSRNSAKRLGIASEVQLSYTRTDDDANGLTSQ